MEFANTIHAGCSPSFVHLRFALHSARQQIFDESRIAILEYGCVGSNSNRRSINPEAEGATICIRSKHLHILVIGSDHIGLVSAAGLAAIGHYVICADPHSDTIHNIEQGQSAVHEPGLDSLIQTCRARGTLTFTSNLQSISPRTETIFLSISAPRLENGHNDFSELDTAIRLLAPALEVPVLFVLRATLPIGAALQVKHLLSVFSCFSEDQLAVAVNPQLLRQGSAIEEFLHPDRILLGVDDSASEKILRRVYQPILKKTFLCPLHNIECQTHKPPTVIVTTARSAELIKQASNSFLALKISYANVVADLCERLSADVTEVTHAVGLDSRIGSSFLDAGLGFGGSRLPDDLHSFAKFAKRTGLDAAILESVMAINASRVPLFLRKIESALWVLKNKQIALLGLAHKPDSSDVHHSPAMQLLHCLEGAGCHVRAYDPEAMQNARAVHPRLVACEDAYEAAHDADALVISTRWNNFQLLDWARIKNIMARPLVFDAQNLLASSQMRRLGFEYHSIGRPD